MTCFGCGKDKKLIKAHVIPESFFIPLRGENGESPKMLSNTDGTHPKRIPIGVYDKTILCRQCENVFEEYDNYGQQVLLKEENEHRPIYKNDTIVGWEVENANQELLKGFFLSVLWRAAISSHNFYSKVDVGEHIDYLKQLVWSHHPGTHEDFSSVLAKFIEHPYGRLTLDPHPEEWFGVNYYRFYLAGYVLSIKVDSKATPEKFSKSALRSTEPFYIFGRNPETAPENKVIQSIARHVREGA